MAMPVTRHYFASYSAGWIQGGVYFDAEILGAFDHAEFDSQLKSLVVEDVRAKDPKSAVSEDEVLIFSIDLLSTTVMGGIDVAALMASD